MKPAILGSIMEHFMSGAETIASDGANDAAGLNYDEGDEDTVQTIKELLDTRVRPAVAQDGGDITFHGFREGIVYLSMRGACAGCPSSTATLQGGIENLLRHFCPDVQEVRAVYAAHLEGESSYPERHFLKVVSLGLSPKGCLHVSSPRSNSV